MDVKALIREQLEFYLGDANLSRDGFFRAEMQRSPDTSIGVDLLLRCNKLRAIGATRESVLEAAKQSQLLEVNESG